MGYEYGILDDPADRLKLAVAIARASVSRLCEDGSSRFPSMFDDSVRDIQEYRSVASEMLRSSLGSLLQNEIDGLIEGVDIEYILSLRSGYVPWPR